MHIRSALLVLLIVYCTPLLATPSKISIHRASGNVIVDGKLDDDVWSSAARVEDWIEYRRTDNLAAPVKTTAWLTFDDTNLYVAFRAEDPDPRKIRAPFVDRDRVLADQDWVAILLDTQNDRKSAVGLRVSPRGVQTDAISSDASSSEDFSPDFHYVSSATIDESGWSVEMRVPLSTLRIKSEATEWGVMLLRNYPRDFRYIMSNTPIPRGSACFVCQSSSLDGVADISPQGSLTLVPYVTANQSTHEIADGGNYRSVADGFENEVGFDLKWSPSALFTVDATLNPDFSQLESDAPQIDVNNRFALSYPEKRSFFLESVDLLSTPIRAVHTRTITAPRWGFRTTGQRGTVAYTALVSEDRGGASVILPGPASTDFAPQDFDSTAIIARGRKSFGRSFGGFLLSAREVAGGGHNRVVGPDFQFAPTDGDKVFGQLLFSQTENPNRTDLHRNFDGRSATGHAARVVWQRDTPKYDVWVNYQDIGEGFRADNGFVPQSGYRFLLGETGRLFYPKRGLSFLRLWMSADRTENQDGTHLRSAVVPGFYFQGKWNSEGWLAFRSETERVGAGEIDSFFLRFFTKVTPFAAVPTLSIDGEYGERIDYVNEREGFGGRIDLSLIGRPSQRIELQSSFLHQWLDTRDSRERIFTASIERLKASYSFSNRSMVRVIGQHSTVKRNRSLYRSPVDPEKGGLQLSALYAFRLDTQTVLFIGGGDSSTLDDSDRWSSDDRRVFLKVGYALRRS